MKRNTFNFITDAVGFAGFIFLTATGVLVRYVLPPGSGHHTTLWGLDRHQWGAVHFWIAVGFLCVLALHLLLHWRWIVSVVRRRPREGSGVRLALGLVGVLAVVAVAVAPFASPVESTGRDARARNGLKRAAHDGEQIRGRMTLDEIEEQTGVPATVLIEHLGMPPDVPLNVEVAKLGRQYGFDVARVRTTISDYESRAE